MPLLHNKSNGVVTPFIALHSSIAPYILIITKYNDQWAVFRNYKSFWYLSNKIISLTKINNLHVHVLATWRLWLHEQTSCFNARDASSKGQQGSQKWCKCMKRVRGMLRSGEDFGNLPKGTQINTFEKTSRETSKTCFWISHLYSTSDLIHWTF